MARVHGIAQEYRFSPTATIEHASLPTRSALATGQLMNNDSQQIVLANTLKQANEIR